MKKLLIVFMFPLVLGLISVPAYGVSFKFDVNQDGVTDDTTQILLCEGKISSIDIYLTGWDQAKVATMDFYFTWDTSTAEVVGYSCRDHNNITCEWVDAQYLLLGGNLNVILDSDYNPGTGEGGIAGPDIFLTTVVLKSITTPEIGSIKASLAAPPSPPDLAEGVIFDADENNYGPSYVSEDNGEYSAICKDVTLDSLEICNSICPAGTPVMYLTYDWQPDDVSSMCRGEMINVSVSKGGFYTAYGTIDPGENICESEVFDGCNRICTEYKTRPCFLQCTADCQNTECIELQTTCQIYDKKVVCNDYCDGICVGTDCQYEKYCGFQITETITVKSYDGGAHCQQGTIYESEPYIISDGCTADANIPLPLADAGPYDICYGENGENLIVTVTTTDCPPFNTSCRVDIQKNPFLVNQGIDDSLPITLEADQLGAYELFLERWSDDPHSNGEPIPGYLQLQQYSSPITEVDVTNGSGPFYSDPFYLKATDPQPVNETTFWNSLLVRAEKKVGDEIICETKFNFQIKNLSANEDCAWDDHFSQGSAIHGRAFHDFLNLSSTTWYDLYVVEHQAAGYWEVPNYNQTIPPRVSGTLQSFQTDNNGDVVCGTTVIWPVVEVPPEDLPAQFDIVIDVNDDGNFDPGVDFVDGNGTEPGFEICLGTGGDGVCDDEDNCPDDYNPGQEDTMPPRGNDCGDACDCEGDFEPDGDVDGTDAVAFKQDFFRKDCSTLNSCNGDFECDGDVDGTDAVKFKADFFRKDCPNYGNPAGSSGWCVY